MTDPELAAAEQRAARELAARLRGHLQNPDGFATRFIADLRREGWRPPLQPPPDWRRTQPPDPGTAHAGAARARAAIADKLEAERLNPTPAPPVRRDPTEDR